MFKQPPPAPTASAGDPCPTIIQISSHWKFTQHHLTTRPPLTGEEDCAYIKQYYLNFVSKDPVTELDSDACLETANYQTCWLKFKLNLKTSSSQSSDK